MAIRLSDLQPGVEATVVTIQGGHGLRRRLFSQGISEGRTLRKVSSLAWGGPVVVRIDRAQVALGRGMANRVLVEPRNG